MKRAPLLQRSILAATIASAAILATSAAQSATKSELRGKAFVEKHCAACHAIGRTGASKDRRAPPLRTLSQRYKLENLEEAFAEGIAVSHKAPEMPPFELEPDTIVDMLAYIQSISPRKRK